MSTVVVGDLHGKYEIAEQVLASPHNVVFIGDYLDSFTHTTLELVKTLDTVLHAATTQPERVTALKGNHELSYLEVGMRCSGYNSLLQLQVRERDLSVLKPFTWLDKYLVSHAGVSARMLRKLNIDYETYLREGKFTDIGYARGGTAPYGGLYWCDWYEEFEPMEIPQIVGHSGYRPGKEKGILIKENSYNIDCLDHTKEVLLVTDGVPEIIKLEDL